MNYILAVDIGTSNTKAVAYSFDGAVLAYANKAYAFSSPQEGRHELDPHLLLNAVIEVINNVVAQAKTNPAGISFSAAMHGLIAVNKNGDLLTPMITWADLRSNDYAQQLKSIEEGKKIYERTGTPIHPMSPLCKLMWMKDNLPEIFNSAHKFISIKEYIFFHFFGEFIIDHSIASSTGLFDIYNLDWNDDALRIAGITAEKLSKHVPVSFIIKGLKEKVLNIDAQTPFVIGGSDGCLAHLGCNALFNGDVSLTIGTSGAVRMMTDKPRYDGKQRLFNYLLTDNIYIAGGPINNGGNVLQWFASNFMKKPFVTPADFDGFITEAFNIEPGSGKLIFLPYIYGERAPVWDAEARGVF